MISILALAAFPLFQTPAKPDRLKPLVPAPEGYTPKATPAPKPAAVPEDSPFRSLGPTPQPQRGALPTPSTKGPRDQKDGRPLPFSEDRPLLSIDGAVIRAGELNQLVSYYRSYRSGSDDMMLQAAVKALLPVKVMQAKFKAQLPDMYRNIEEAHEAAVAGEDFASVVKRFSQDSEAPTDDGRYTFGRDQAVQPFDRICHSTPVNGFSAPFLTVYGYHFLQVLDYQRGEKPKDDQSTSRHVLIMFPEMVQMEKEGKDVRSWIKQQVQAAKIEVLEAGMQNLVPPANRGQITGQ
ncbi:MAG: peptidylprolyl isomerase [Planctomycetota bacterium]